MKSKSDPELELLSSALETFHQASGQLEQTYSQLEEKVEDLTRELEKKNRELEEEAARRNRLTSMGEMAAKIAHEIRNPLGGIALFASLLKEELHDDPDRLALVGNISTGVQSLNHILSNLLYYSRPLRPVFLPLSVQGVLKESLAFAGHLLGQKGIRWSCEHRGEDRELISDGELLKQILMNLILNAVQAMPGGGDLQVTSEIEEKEVHFHITDNGPGIPEENLQKIFHPFYTTRPKGTGLGLAIVHQLVESLGGKISVESRLGDGTTFVLAFPLTGCSSESGEGIPASWARELQGVMSNP